MRTSSSDALPATGVAIQGIKASSREDKRVSLSSNKIRFR